MRSTSLPIILPVSLLVLFCLFSEGSADSHTGERTWGEVCNPNASLHDDQSNRCDTSKRLSCDARSNACVCHHGERDFYNKAEDRCETQVGKFCSPSETFPTICVKNAVCDPTNFCLCKPGAIPHVDGSECIGEMEDGENGATSSNSLQHHFIAAAALLTIGAQLWD